jgi:uncharacterized protein (TIRG00374 family)
MLKKRYLGFTLAAGLLFLFLSRADWGVIEAEFRAVGWSWLAMAVVIRFISLIAASLRWQVLLSPLKRVALAPLFSAMMIGMSADTLVAMQSAEFVRPFLLSRWENIPFGSTFATVMVEWFVDLLGMLAFLIPASIIFRASSADGFILHHAMLARIVPIALAGSLVGLGLLWFLGRNVTGIERFFSKGPSAVPESPMNRLGGWIKSFSRGLEIMQQPKRLAEITFYSLLSAFLVSVCAWTVLSAFGLTLPFFASFILLAFIAGGGMVPTPGAVGGFHAALQLGLAVFFQIDPARTILPVIGLHAVLYLPPTLVGVFCVGRQGLTLKRIQEGVAAARVGG